MTFKKLIFFFFLITYLIFGWYANEIQYGIRQLDGQLMVMNHTKPINFYLNDSVFPDSLKQKIRFIQKVREFGISFLQMSDSKNYKSLYNQNGKPTLWVVSAAPAFDLKPYRWHFPLVGSFPYKGYFKSKLVKEEAKRLKKLGYDVDIDIVSAWSTLGWFADPILSNNLNSNKGELANLILHELTHSTIYVKDSIEMNENLATFIGNKGAIAFLKQYPGGDSLLAQYLSGREDKKIYINYIHQQIKKLDSLYKKIRSYPPELKIELKNKEIEKIRAGLKTLPFHNPKLKKRLQKNKISLNNAYFAGFNTYHKQQFNFEKELKEKFNGHLKSFLNYYKNKYPTL